MGRKKKKQKVFDYVNLPPIELGDKTKNSIYVVFLAVFGLLSFLGLFNLSGQFGVFISKYLGIAFGVGKWLVPLIFIYWALALVSKNKRTFKFTDYFGLSLLFISYQSLFHFFLEQSKWIEIAKSGNGGGYVGYYLSQFFNHAFGFWGGVIILIALFLISLLLFFNTSLSKIIGRESFLLKIFKPFIEFFKALFSKSEEEEKEEGEEDDNEEENKEEEKESIIEKARSEVLNSWEKKDIKRSSDDEINPASLHEGKTKVQEKISWPKKSIKIDLPLSLLNNKISKAEGGNTNHNAERIQKTLAKFGINVEMGETKIGPTVTQYTFRPEEGVKLSRVTSLNNDLSLSLAAHPIRIEAPIPGKSLVGVEVPNETKAIVGLREILESSSFKKRKNNLMIALGKDVAGNSWLYDLSKMPHLLVAGATNSGKSVCLNTIIISLLYQNNPDDLRFIMVDPKRVELPTYNGIPHLLTPVITEVNKTINALKWCLNEMDRRYDLLNKYGKRNIHAYNEVAEEKIPYIVFIVDELADFMMTSGKEIEAAIIRLAQMSRAIGIHLILATQRPSVDVITGLIKANIPSRIAFSVASLVDSKTILDSSGAEKLLGQGDMLFSTAEVSKPKRIQGAFLSDEEINNIVGYIKEKSGEAEYLEGITDRQKVSGIAGVGLDGNHGDEDELFEEAKEIIIKAGKASTSMLQRRLSIGYGRAAKILDMLEESNIIGPPNGSKPREVMVSQEQYQSESNAMSSAPIHDRNSSKAPENYFSNEDEGDDGTLSFTNQSSDEEEIDDADEADEEVEVKNEEEENNLDNDADEEEHEDDDGNELVKKDLNNENEDDIDEDEEDDIDEDEDNNIKDKDEDNKENNKEEKKGKTKNENGTEKKLPFDEDDEMFFAR
ncbi:MAG: DNA translocase FtsK 4TM domain-containing protein [Patescibacteria group bacterium]|jgi:S-DNA-T family DNA segregation ATPase FtsK/SpoIIIE|nr:DNA translocase FtsK 4TM domain-containing protein [Patescibacteria group bacterium]